MDRLEPQEINERLELLLEWKLDEKFISRRYRFESFLTAVSFVNKVAEVAEQNNHHPFISIDYKMVTLRLTTWHAGGLTKLDFDEATQCDKIAADMTETNQ